METKKLDEVKSLKEQSKALATYFDAYAKGTEEPSCDKKANGFDLDGRFSVFSIKVSFDAWRGYYGNSGCSTFSNGIYPSKVDSYLIQALNRHKELLFKTAAELMMKEAVKLTSEAEEELKALSEMMEEIKAA